MSLAKTGKNESNRDVILDYRLSGEHVESGVMLYRGKEENFFLVMVEPPAAFSAVEIPPRQYLFIVDVSGSLRAHLRHAGTVVD